jgi:predicted amidophosphoribosyltransferase
MGGRHPRQGIRRTSELFKRFKTGQKELTYPLALGIHRRLDEEVSGSFDAIVPIPLSPEKASAGEIHRTRLLARELSALRQVPVREVLSLDVAISKRRLRTMQGLGYRQFEARYYQALQVDSTAGTLGRILLVDDVCTEGSTMRSAARRLAEASPHAEIVLAAAGQMVVRPAVLDETALLQTAA